VQGREDSKEKMELIAKKQKQQEEDGTVEVNIMEEWQEILKKKKKRKSTVNQSGNYTKPALRRRIFNRIKRGGKGGAPGQWSARKAQMMAQAYKRAGGGYKN
tara:strand:+ start:116 stop:421 length:306 start_codon:yes stop_codon:yes gene_type:complete